MTTSRGSSPTDASTTVIRPIRLISGPVIGQKRSSAMELAAAKTGMTRAPCPLVAASILSFVIESGSKVEAIVAAKTTLSLSYVSVSICITLSTVHSSQSSVLIGWATGDERAVVPVGKGLRTCVAGVVTENEAVLAIPARGLILSQLS
ncbi:MAG: hypothetical protein A4E36_00769 [Methanoregulaceae archaeon PtaB.Bin009]|nr:MAG: hypothetical protein A4E36_00769 [Methanoregulaceae archaeon PtaB.Bin009]